MAYEFAPTTKTGLYFNETGPAIFENCFSITIIFYPILALPNICEKSCQIFVILGQIFVTISTTVIFRKYLALAQTETSLTRILIPNSSGHLFHKYLG